MRADQPNPDLAAVLVTEPDPFALLYRPESAGADSVEVLTGEVESVYRLADLPLPGGSEPGTARHDVLAVVPFRQVTEKGFACRDDGEPILAMTVARQSTVGLDEVLRLLPHRPIPLDGARYEPDDEAYEAMVREILSDEIGAGTGSNFVIKRSFKAEIPGYDVGVALALFRQLLAEESGAYWTFVVHTGSRTFVGATPELHASVTAGEVVMNPISGTYRYPATGPTVAGSLAFLSDHKEADELLMVVDEELKMMASICPGGGQVFGPYLKQMARVAHTEYLLYGQSSLDVREVIRRTLVAPTVTGSPVESACRVIAKREPVGRGYYSGVLALIGRDDVGRRALDSAILIRTADIDASGAFEVGVGGTLVRDSVPAAEVAETAAKVAGLLGAAGVDGGDGGDHVRPTEGHLPQSTKSLSDDQRVHVALERRNGMLARYWFETEDAKLRPDPRLVGLRGVVLDAEDTFTAMLAQQLRSLGADVTIRSCLDATEEGFLDSCRFVVAGPGPGDPQDYGDPRIAALRTVVDAAQRQGIPLLCVCLSHQVLASSLGLDLVRKTAPNQGVQQQIDLFGQQERVGFYNTFAAHSRHDVLHRVGTPGGIEVSRHRRTGEVYALRGPGFASTQFHPESLLTQNGVDILAGLLASTMTNQRATTPVSRLVRVS